MPKHVFYLRIREAHRGSSLASGSSRRSIIMIIIKMHVSIVLSWAGCLFEANYQAQVLHNAAQRISLVYFWYS